MSAFPNDKQEQILSRIVEGSESMLVVSGPGTGKSLTALEAARRRLVAFPTESTQQVLFLSFSNAAVQRLAKSAGLQFSKAERRRLRFMTFHSLAAELLSHYGRFVGLPPSVRVADKLEERLVAFESGWDNSGSEYQWNLVELAKSRGLLCFDVLIPLALSLLNNSLTLRKILCRRYPLIIVDEFQDTSEAQWRLLQAYGASSQVVGLGDPNQIIYSSIHAATARRLSEFEQWKRTKAVRLLTSNFRCSETEILAFAECLLNGQAYPPRKDSNVELYNVRFRNRLRACLALTWKAIQEAAGKNQTIGILVPSNALVEDVAVGLRNPPPESGVQFPVFTQMARDEAAYDAVVLSLAALRDMAINPCKLTYRKAAVAMLAMNTSWNNRLKPKCKDLEILARKLENIRCGDNSHFGQLLSLLKADSDVGSHVLLFVKVLAGISEFRTTAKKMGAHIQVSSRKVVVRESQLPLFDDVRKERTPKGLYGYDAWEGKTHVLTFHKAKAREFDFVVMVVDPRHESSRAPLDERRRLYYVSATRAKKWLGVMHFGSDLGPVLGPVLKPFRHS